MQEINFKYIYFVHKFLPAPLGCKTAVPVTVELVSHKCLASACPYV